MCSSYETGEAFVRDVTLMFDNCRTFNEDQSAIGKAGHAVRRFFARRWAELQSRLTVGTATLAPPVEHWDKLPMPQQPQQQLAETTADLS